MSGNGGFKQRQTAMHNRRNQRKKNATANLVRVRNQFESKGQTWDPQSNPAQMSALNHDARRLVNRPRKP